MTDAPHPPGHDEAMEIAIKTGLRALHETKGAFWERNDARSDAMCLAYLAAMRPQIAREARKKALREAASMAESARLACLKNGEWLRGAQISERLRDDILVLITNAETNDE